jgi:hypothetical protein
MRADAMFAKKNCSAKKSNGLHFEFHKRARSIKKVGAGEKSRTPDLRITNALLYQLSYTGGALGWLMPTRKPRILVH